MQTASQEINQNCTYIQNPGFPSAYTETTALTYTIRKCADDVCAVRLDFETFTTQGPADTEEISGGVCVDSLVVSGTSGLSSPVICGMNTGQHGKYLKKRGKKLSAFLALFCFIVIFEFSRLKLQFFRHANSK